MVEVGNIPASTIFFLVSQDQSQRLLRSQVSLIPTTPISRQPPAAEQSSSATGLQWVPIPLRSKSVTTHRDESTLRLSLKRQVWGKPSTHTVPIRDNGSVSSCVTTSRTCPLHYADAAPTAVRPVCGDNSPPTGGLA